MRRMLAGVLASGAVAGVAIAVAHEGGDGSSPLRHAPAAAAPLPAPDGALARAPGALADDLTVTTRRLRDALARWDPTAPVPRDVTYLALRHQRILRLMAARRALGDAALAL